MDAAQGDAYRPPTSNGALQWTRTAHAQRLHLLSLAGPPGSITVGLTYHVRPELALSSNTPPCPAGKLPKLGWVGTATMMTTVTMMMPVALAAVVCIVCFVLANSAVCPPTPHPLDRVRRKHQLPCPCCVVCYRDASSMGESPRERRKKCSDQTAAVEKKVHGCWVCSYVVASGPLASVPVPGQ